MRFLPTLSLALGIALWAAGAAAESVRILVHSSPLAGAQYYAVDALWTRMHVGDALDLVREPDNRHDRNAIRVEWQGQKIGYLPRRANRAVATALDRGDRLVARISRLTEDPDPWRRVEFEVYAEL